MGVIDDSFRIQLRWRSARLKYQNRANLQPALSPLSCNSPKRGGYPRALLHPANFTK